MKSKTFSILPVGDEKYDISLPIEDINLIAMGFTARNQEQMEKNLNALKREGIEFPDDFPQVYRISRLLATDEDFIEVVSDSTCGEVEYLILKHGDKHYIGVGSDHADKELEKSSIINSKQICGKPHSVNFWKYDEIKEHWDTLILRSWQETAGEEVLYQENTVANILEPEKIIKKVEEKITGDYLVFSGSVANLTGYFIYGDRFRYEIYDPIINRSISGVYNIVNLNQMED